MEDVIGGRTDPERFRSFLADWRPILARRVDQAVAALVELPGVHGLVLAGGVGRGEPWPLSDIDLLPIYEDGWMSRAQAQVEKRRLELLAEWIDEGWWTGLDIGRLAFQRAEIVRAINLERSEQVVRLLGDDRWYHSIDKGYGGRAVYDPEGLADGLAHWVTDHRFSQPVVLFRLARELREVDAARRQLQMAVDRGDALEGAKAVRDGVKWLQTWMLEGWGERDASLGRIGARFDRIAHARCRMPLVAALNALSDLDDASVERRMAAAPAWVLERHDRSWRARRYVGEDITRLDDARDTLRVCSHYEIRRASAPIASWLAVPVDTQSLKEKAIHLTNLVDQVSANTPDTNSE